MFANVDMFANAAGEALFNTGVVTFVIMLVSSIFAD